MAAALHLPERFVLAVLVAKATQIHGKRTEVPGSSCQPFANKGFLTVERPAYLPRHGQRRTHRFKGLLEAMPSGGGSPSLSRVEKARKASGNRTSPWEGTKYLVERNGQENSLGAQI